MFKEVLGLANLEINIVLSCLGTQPDLLGPGGVRVLSQFFLAVVLVLAVIHDPADRGPRFGRDFHQVQIRLFGQLHSLSRVDDADLFALGVDQAHLWHADGIVDSCERLLLSGDSLGLRSMCCG